MVNIAKGIVAIAFLGSVALWVIAYQIHDREIEIAEREFNNSEELSKKFGKSVFRLLSRVRKSGGNGKWRMSLHFISLRESSLVHIQADFAKDNSGLYQFTGGAYWADGSYAPLTYSKSGVP